MLCIKGALKIKEMCYLHAEGFSGGALKHGPFALIQGTSPKDRTEWNGAFVNEIFLDLIFFSHLLSHLFPFIHSVSPLLFSPLTSFSLLPPHPRTYLFILSSSPLFFSHSCSPPVLSPPLSSKSFRSGRSVRPDTGHRHHSRWRPCHAYENCRWRGTAFIDETHHHVVLMSALLFSFPLFIFLLNVLLRYVHCFFNINMASTPPPPLYIVT